jgi:hypothetical protein
MAVSVELVCGFQEVFAGDAEFAWFLFRIREWWFLGLRDCAYRSRCR